LAPISCHRHRNCLIGCTVAPGFELDDFELAANAELELQYPAVSAQIRRMRRPEPLG
jgi:predicted cupin superfamily sugar epimerase